MTSSANLEQIEYWDTVTGPRWVAAQERLDAMIESLGAMAIERAAVQPGERVVDVGCGCGATSLTLARQVGPEGRVLGVDVSRPMLARARERAESAGLDQLRFEWADAQTHDFRRGFAPAVDLVFSRFGVMFFEDPVAAFRNLAQALGPEGRLVFVCWQPLDVNPWMARPLEVVGRFAPPRPLPEPGAPGPFAFADPERVRGILSEAGLASIEIEGRDYVQRLGDSVADALEFLLTGVGPVASALAEAAPEARDGAARALEELLAEHASPRGVELDSAVWLVTARPAGARPG